jgi:predicted ATPase
MIEKLTIKGFCGIKRLSIQLADITVLIGPQATGKSICAKSLYYFKSFFGDMLDSIEENKSRAEFDEVLKGKFEEYFPAESWSQQFVLRYEIQQTRGKSNYIQVRRSAKKAHIRLTYSEPIKRAYEALRRTYRAIVKKTKGGESGRDYTRHLEFEESARAQTSAVFGARAEGTQLFIPAGRSFFAILQSSIFRFLATNKAIDPFLKVFGSYYESMKRFEYYGYDRTGRNRRSAAQFEKTRDKIDELVYGILKGKYVSERGKDYLISADGRKTNVANSSSGQQETLPLAIILRNLQSRPGRIMVGATVYIEEPEAHIFPAAQRQIVRLIALLYNASKRRAPLRFVLTTHSPYILTAINNLLQAGRLFVKARGTKKAKLLQLVDEEELLAPTEVRCYSVHDGIAEPMMDRDSELIRSDVIDKVSDELSIEFGKLLELD